VFRISGLLTGAAAFAVVHLLERAAWRGVFEPAGEHAAWFLNSGRAVAFAAACLFVASMVYTSVRRRSDHARSHDWGGDALNLAVGAGVAMTAVLAVIGPGTIFPVALAIGLGVAAASCVGGAFAGTKL